LGSSLEYRHYELPNQIQNQEVLSDIVAINCFNNGADKAEVTMYQPGAKRKSRLTLEYSRNNDAGKSDGSDQPLRYHIRAL
jgi:hypothetical protein